MTDDTAGSSSTLAIKHAVRDWLQRAVIGLNLCPFAAGPFHGGRVRIQVSAATTPLELLTDVQLELARLADSRPERLETTLIAIPHLFSDFLDFNDFLDEIDALLEEFEWAGEFQVASFHPDYQFAGTAASAPGNCTNRSPLPLLHLLREASVAAAVAQHPDPDGIPEANIARLEAMTLAEREALFVRLAAGGLDPD